MDKIDIYIQNIQENFIISHFLLCLLYLTVFIIIEDPSPESFVGQNSIPYLLIVLGTLILTPLYKSIINNKFKSAPKNRFAELLYITTVLAIVFLVISTLGHITQYRIILAVPVVLVALNCQLRASLFFAFALGLYIFIYDFWTGHHLILYKMDLMALTINITLAYTIGKITKKSRELIQKLTWEKTFSQNLLDNLPQAIIVSDQTGTIITFSNNSKITIDLPQDNITGLPEDELWEFLGIGEIFSNQQPIINKEIKYQDKYLLVNRSSLQISNDFRGNITILHDITEKREHEEKMKRTSTLSVVGELAAATAHEIKNPLTTAQGFIQHILLQPSKTMEEIKNHLELLLEEINRINRIITDFLKLAKPKKTELVVIDPNKLLQNTYELVEKEAKYRNLQLTWNTPVSLPPTYGDPDQLKQVLLNLIQNAIQACSLGGQVKVAAKPEQNFLLITVEDNGAGIPDELKEKIFQPFFTTKDMGTGLGLAISKRIIIEHSGKIMIEDSPLGGAMFIVKIPLFGSNN